MLTGIKKSVSKESERKKIQKLYYCSFKNKIHRGESNDSCYTQPIKTSLKCCSTDDAWAMDPE